MSKGIFATEANKYWGRGFPVVPVNGKAPIPTGWSGFLGGMPNEAKRSEWVGNHGEQNIGLLLGYEINPGWVVDALDVDDDRLVKLAYHILGLTRAGRRAVLAGKRGKKGATIFVRAPKSLKSTVIKGSGGLGNIDFLAGGRMTVMPPSIHPETNKAYETVGTSLLDVELAELPEINNDLIKLLKAAIGSEHAAVLISGTGTHDAGVAFTGLLVHAGATDDDIEAIFKGLLPDGYSGDTFKELSGWVSSARQKGFGDADGDSPTLTNMLVALALKSGAELFNDGDGNAFITFPRTGSAVAYRIKSDTTKLWLRHQAYVELKTAVSSSPLAEALATIETKALFDGKTSPVFARVAGDNDNVVIDIGATDGRVVHIDRTGTKVLLGSRFKFVRGAGFEPLPIPQDSGTLSSLKAFLGLDDHNYHLLLAFLVNALKPQGPYFVLLVEGEQGSGKSFFCEIVKRIIDPNKAMRLRLPDKPQDLMIQAKEYRLLPFDNASGMNAEMSDALCSLATGGGVAYRKLYTDGELHVMSYSRPFMINGISGYANRPDLMERAIPIRLSPMQEGGRKTEAELLTEFEALLPGILGALYNAVAGALQNVDKVDPPRHLRMADAARWIKAAEPALGVEVGTIVDAIAKAQDDFIIEKVNEEPLVTMLRIVCRSRPFEGYVLELFAEFRNHNDAVSERSLPKTPSHLSNQLKRMRPAMAKTGVHVEFLEKDRRGKRVKIWIDGPLLTPIRM